MDETMSKSKRKLQANARLVVIPLCKPSISLNAESLKERRRRCVLLLQLQSNCSCARASA